ncbi:hypothetical protein ACQP2P_21195 [Dactylosporangium sp. CA-139114]|uniref:hypothetical protein n=1 Tax=Dactylosporangium sp. CA-139114 TaxID=3239931 RepID=UPI003D96D60C
MSKHVTFRIHRTDTHTFTIWKDTTTMSASTTTPATATGGFTGDPASALSVAGTSGCCGSAAKADAVASSQGCCG